ncbi:hypothetical protein GFK91_30650 (plasmid) [Roseibium aggregatum]|uniref:hypothetical protein n=1 Tax=Roseibium aggregatum TaxID=187304 RepID=UPI001E642964|nr:hypothetical protein [Roseibium aggregatum]UES60102.1 hypothetical protein GFK91_30650 [Roseibium aggregatum]
MKSLVIRDVAFLSFIILLIGLAPAYAQAQTEVACKQTKPLSPNVSMETFVLTPSDIDKYALRYKRIYIKPNKFSVSSKQNRILPRKDGGTFEVSYEPLSPKGLIKLSVPFLYAEEFQTDSKDIVALLTDDNSVLEEWEISTKLVIDHGFTEYDLGLLKNFSFNFDIDDLPVFSGRASAKLAGQSADGDIKFEADYMLFLLPQMLAELDKFAESHKTSIEKIGYCLDDNGKKYYRP